MIDDFRIIFSWWILFFGLGIVFLPLTWWFFRKFFDLGYPFSKIIAILLVSYLVWLLGSLHLLPFTTATIWFVILILAGGNIILVKKYLKELSLSFKRAWKILSFEEVLFFVALVVWSFIRGFQPDIEGLEKFMDFGFVNSILRSTYFPPADMWMAGETINYYYFGHLVAAILTKLSGISSTITYNVMIATIFALAFTATFSLGANLYYHATSLLRRNEEKRLQWKPVFFAGLLSAGLLTLGGNLHSLWWFLTHNLSFTGYWYPDATRFIVEKFGALDNTIHEFPLYSFVVSDLHGHVLDVPFVLLFLALLFAWLSSPRNKTLITNYQLLITPLVLAVMYMTNSWDFPIYFLIFAVAVSYFYYSKCGLSRKSIFNIGILVVLVFIGSILFSLPFHLHFSQIAQGLDFVNNRSPFWQLLVLWGYQWVIALGFILFLVTKKRLTYHISHITPDVFILILLVVATILIIIPEVFYVKDIYIASYHRANTMFKLVYQSFMIYALCAGYIVFRIFAGLRQQFLRFLYIIFLFPFFIFIFLYPYFAINSYYGNLKIYRGLEGLGFIKKSTPDDYAGILWLTQNIKGQPVVLEAVGDSYTDYNRVSALTGLPTIEGWLVHEWLWRGSFDEPGRRAADVQTIFESKDPILIQNLLTKYQVKYVFLGTKEREKYQVAEDKFKTLGFLVFLAGNTKIYQLEKANRP